jgi:hypothetical protein
MRRRISYGLLLLAVMAWPVLAVAQELFGVLTPAAQPPRTTLYDYHTTIEIQEDFALGTNTSGNIGARGFAGSGTISQVAGEAAGRLGLFRFDTGATSGTVSRVSFNAASSVDPSVTTNLFWIVRLNTNDANTTIRVGAQNTSTANPPTHGMYLEKLDGDTDWFCITRSASVQTRTDSTIAVSTNFVKIGYLKDATGVQFTIDDVPVCGLVTTNIPTNFLSPAVQIANSANASKTVDVDYFQYKITGFTR